LQVMPRVAATTRESRSRSAWAIARRIHALLSAAKSTPAELADPAEPAKSADLKQQPSDALADPAGEPPPA
jgi:D-3-phosphoglycerate dehydrogenase